MKKTSMWVAIFVIVFSIGISVSYFIYKQGSNDQAVINKTSTQTKTQISPSPKKIDLSLYKISILNGSGISGEASQLKETLENSGFTVSSTDNADSSDYQKTLIQKKDNVEDAFINELKDVLKKQFVLGDFTNLQSTADSDVVIITGSENAQ